MTARRLILALVIALIVSGMFTFWLSRRVAAARNVQPTQQRLVAAARTLEAGEVLKADTLRLVDWPISMPIDGAYTKTSDLVGRAVLYPLAAGQPILDRHLAAPGSGYGLTAKIPDGMRAISMRSDEVVGVAGFLLPGTHVDVLETRAGVNGASSTSTVLQDVEVLAAGQKIEPDPEGKPSSVNVVTLLLKPEDAEKVMVASTQGAIHFVLRNGGDRTRIDDAPPAVAVVRRAAKPIAKPKIYSVETTLGTKKVVTTF